MRIIEFDYQVFSMVEISGEELGRLSKMSQKHYDGKCKAAGRLGGFLYGFIQQWIASSACGRLDLLGSPKHCLAREIVIRVSPDQLGTLAKICEQDGSGGPYLEMLERCAGEYNRLADNG